LGEFFKLLPLVIIAALLSAIGLHFYLNYWQAPPSESSIVVNPPSKPQTISGRASVIDGDTIEIHSERIRLFGIDAPESGQPCTIQGKTSLIGKDAAFALTDKIGGQVVECRPRDRDRFNRRVAVCSVGGERHPDQSQYNVSKYSIIPPATEWAQRTKHLRNASERGNRPEISGSA